MPPRSVDPALADAIAIIGFHGGIPCLAAGIQAAGGRVVCIASHSTATVGDDVVLRGMAARGIAVDAARCAADIGAAFFIGDPNQPETVAQLKAHGVRAVVSMSAPILKLPFLRAFDGLVFNIHGSSTYRGRGGLSWALLNGLTQDDVVLHWIDEGIDTGEEVCVRPFAWGNDAYPLDLFAAQIDAIGGLGADLVGCLRRGAVPGHPQSAARPYLPGLATDRDGWLEWSWSAAALERAARAFGWPYGGASARLENGRQAARRLRIGRAAVIDPGDFADWHPLTHGAVVARDAGAGSVDVVCGDGLVRLLTVRDGDGERLAATEIRLGDRLRGRAFLPPEG